MASICCAQERSEDKSSPRYLIDSTRSRLELCSLKGGGCEGLFSLCLHTSFALEDVKMVKVMTTEALHAIDCS